MNTKVDWEVLQHLIQLDGFVGMSHNDGVWRIVVEKEADKETVKELFREGGVLHHLETIPVVVVM